MLDSSENPKTAQKNPQSHRLEEELQSILAYFTSQIKMVEAAIGTARRKRASPISASLPNIESTYFLDRIGALKKSLANRNETKTSENVDPPPRFKTENHFPPIFTQLNESECKRLTQPELVAELKQRGTYNPELMAWDAIGVIRFLDRTIHDHYQRQPPRNRQREEAFSRNVEALASLLKELNVTCDLRSPSVLQKLQNATFGEPRRSILSPSLRRSKRTDQVEEILRALNLSGEVPRRSKDQPLTLEDENMAPRQRLIGESHIVPFGCDKRGAEEDGYLRLCGACQAIRHLPDTFFPPFINEVTCDSDKACLYFYDYPHGKCRQKHMNFVVLRNVGTNDCQIWKKFNLNVRVSCECFVDEMSFFAKYV
ncbi:unnamed protein product [Cylicocyclus nassatus]|uniref:Spaetzle domain-containing protein n=1 Tax=Cylicocyclus nassatus TaxID=53992 RepID=A0AA36MGC7_CYLNA|nr:unnamed protein product [Cylicocyclus nassatus]